MRIYDPTVGTGGMLVQASNYVSIDTPIPPNIYLFGQDIHESSWAICKINLLLHGISDADIRLGDVLRAPQHIDNGELMTFDRVLANPPLSLNRWGKEEAESDPFGRFQYGIPPKSSGDLAFIQHMIASLDSEGMMGIIMSHGVLFRGSSEKTIRKGILDADLLEAVVNLPPKLLFAANLPLCLLVLNKKKPAQRKDKVIFINGELQFEEGKVNNKLRKEDIDKIVATFDEYKENKWYSKVLSLESIQDADYNLNINILKAQQQIELLETQYKQYDQYTIKEVANEIIMVKAPKQHKDITNAIYIPRIGNSKVIANLQDATLKHHNYYQVVLNENAINEYVASFFQSKLGRLVLKSLVTDSVIPHTNKRDIEHAIIALPNVTEQQSIAQTHAKLKELKDALNKFDKEISVNPTSSSQIHGQIDMMLKAIDLLSESDWVRSVIREGESKIIEFKETLCMDTKKLTKEKYIELSGT